MRPISVFWQRYWLLPLLLMAGYLGNYFSLPLFFGVDFIFGSIATLMVVVYYGSAWGVLSALIAGSYTLILWQHPYALIILVAEAAFLGWCLRRRQDNLVLLDIVFWLFLGIPLVYIFYHFALGMTETPTRLIMVKQSTNGIFNSLIAVFLINSFGLATSSLPSSQSKPHAHKLSFEQTLFNLLMAFLFFPLLLVTVISGQQAFKTMERGINNELTAIAYPVQNAVQQWFDDQLLGVTVVAKQAAPLLTQLNQGNAINRQDLALLTESFQTAFTSYDILVIGDRQGTIVASFPQFNQVGESLIGRQQTETLDQITANQSQPLIGDLHRDQTDINPHVGITVPILSPTRQLEGFTYASLSLEKAANLIHSNESRVSQDLILIDRQNRVLAASTPNLTLNSSFDPTEGGSIREIDRQTYHWFPNESISPMLSWRKSYYYQILPIENSPNWQLIVRLSATNQIENLQRVSVKKLGILLSLTVGGLITSILVSRRVAFPLLKLSRFTTDIPNKLSQRAVNSLVLNSQVSEVAVLNDNFNEMLATLKNQFQTIEAARDSLESRVEERTQELLTINQKLAEEIRERERIERVLRQSEERYDLAVSGTNDGLWDWNIAEENIYYSPVWKKILGYQPDAIPFNQEWLTKVHPDDRQGFQQGIIDHLNGTGGVFSQTLRLENVMGEYRWVDVKGNCLRDDRGTAYRMVGTITDINDKKAVEAELRRAKENAELANRTKSEFLANISHEIRTPMNAILGFCELLQGTVDSPRSRSYLAAIGSSSKTLMALIDDILDISKIEAGKLAVHRDLVDLKEILREIKQIFKQKARSKGIGLVTQLVCPVTPIIYFDEIRLRQILFNIVGNALKFTDQGQVSIQIIVDRQQGDLIQLTIGVADTGIGIAPADQDRIFDVFTQSEGQSSRKYGGTGLGLTITKRLTQLLGGSLTLDSQLGRGSVFTLHFPGVQLGEEGGMVPLQCQRHDLSQFAPLRVLVVDDVESNRQLLKGFFDVTGHAVVAVESGPAAIAVSQQQGFDLVLMDLMMPGMDGQEAIAEIRKTAQNPTMPIVMVTASSQPLSHLLTPQGCQAILLKPVTQGDLVAVLRDLVPLVNAPDEDNAPPPVAPDALACPLFSADQRQTLIDLLEQQETLVWAQLRHTLISRELRAFGDRLQTWGQDYDWPSLTHYAQSLLTALDNFDSHQLQTLMADFPQFRATLTPNIHG